MAVENLLLGAEHANKIGKVVTVDVVTRGGRYLITGVFHSARDIYARGDRLEKTVLVVGTGAMVELDWEEEEVLVAEIEVHD